MSARDVVVAALLAEAASGNAFRAKALKAAAAVVAGAEPFEGADAAEALAGKVSDRMLERIVAIIDSPPSPDLDVVAAQELQSVTCIGAAAAKKLVAKGVRDLADLDARAEEPGLLTAAQRLCVAHRLDIALRIPRAEMHEHAAVVAAAARTAGCVAHVVGSYRRRAETSGDVDVLMCGDGVGVSDMIAAFPDGYVVGAIARGAHKFMGLVRLREGARARRIDILKTTAEQLPFALLHFTGPDTFNIALRNVARERGLRLSENGWGDCAGGLARPESEADVLKELGLDRFVEPWDRADWAQAAKQ